MNGKNILLVNSPFIMHRETCIFKGIDDLCVYEDYKERMRRKHRKDISNKLFPYDFDLVIGVRAGAHVPGIRGPVWYNYAPFPFLMAYASSLLQKNGHNAEIIDCVGGRIFQYDRFLSSVSLRKPDIVIIEISQASKDIDLWLCRKISEFSSVALAGPFVDEYTVHELRQENPHIKFFLKGNYIISSIEMARTNRHGIYESTSIENFDFLPFPDRGYIGADMTAVPWIPNAERPVLQIKGSNNAKSFRSIKSIADEISAAFEIHKYKYIHFDDEVFAANEDQIEQFCPCLKAHGIPWGVRGLSGDISLPLFDKLVAAGCRDMGFTVEFFHTEAPSPAAEEDALGRTWGAILCLSNKYPDRNLHIALKITPYDPASAVYDLDVESVRSLGFSERLEEKRSFHVVGWEKNSATEFFSSPV
jgi:hypothetical protein